MKRASPVALRAHSAGAWLVVAACAACSAGSVVSFYSVEGHHFSWWERHTINRITIRTIEEVRLLLADLPADPVVRVSAAGADEDVSDVTGAAGNANSSAIYWRVDPDHPDGIAHVANIWLRQTLYHELHHLVRFNTVGPGPGLIGNVIVEGLATAFERDFAGGPVPWGAYPPEVDLWADELIRLPESATRDDWMARLPTGAKEWLVHRTGTYLADLAMSASGRSAADLVSAPTADIARLALGDMRPVTRGQAQRSETQGE